MAALLAATPTSAEMEFSRAGAQDFVRNIPSMLKSNLKTFRVGTSTMWKNWGAAKEVQRAVLADSSRLSYSDLILIRKSKEDTNKFLFSGFIWMAAPELFPAMLYFNPRSIPSTFEGENGRQKRLNSMVRMRTKSALDLLSTLEEQAAGTGKKAAAATAHCEIAERLLRAKSTPKALAYLQGCASQPEEGDKAFAELEKIAQREKRRKRTASPWMVRGAGKASLLGISPPALKAGCQLIGRRLPASRASCVAGCSASTSSSSSRRTPSSRGAASHRSRTPSSRRPASTAASARARWARTSCAGCSARGSSWSSSRASPKASSHTGCASRRWRRAPPRRCAASRNRLGAPRLLLAR